MYVRHLEYLFFSPTTLEVEEIETKLCKQMIGYCIVTEENFNLNKDVEIVS